MSEAINNNFAIPGIPALKQPKLEHTLHVDGLTLSLEVDVQTTGWRLMRAGCFAGPILLTEELSGDGLSVVGGVKTLVIELADYAEFTQPLFLHLFPQHEDYSITLHPYEPVIGP